MKTESYNPENIKIKRSTFRRLILLFHYLKRTGFFKEIGVGFLQFLLFLGAAVGVLILINNYVIDISDVFDYIVTHVPIYIVFLFFTLNEAFLGLIPPDLFVVWSEELHQPYFILTLMGILSYLGGMVSFQIGIGLKQIPFIHRWINKRFAKHVKNIRRWGGWIIVAGAVTPLPFSLLVIITGMLGYPFKRYLIYGFTRLPRFILYALIIFRAVNL